MTDLNKGFFSFFYTGEQHANGTTAKRKVLHSNIIAGTAVVTATIYAIFYLLSGTNNVVLSNSASIQITFIPFFFTTFFFNYYGWLRLARWVMSLVAISMIFLMVSYGQGNYLNAHFFFLGFCGIIVSSFPISQWPAIIFLSALNIFLFVTCEAGYFLVFPEVHEIDASVVAVMRIMNILSSILLMVGSILLAEYASSKSDLKLEAMSTTDSLTNILNRRGFMLRFEQEKARCSRSKSYGGLLYIDLNDFKSINDKHGHEIGDTLLQQVARLIEKSLRETDVVARLGGDEFVALIADIDASKDIAISKTTDIAKKINFLFANECSLSNDANHPTKAVDYKCSASIGITPFNGESDVNEVIKLADQAMYRQKNAVTL